MPSKTEFVARDALESFARSIGELLDPLNTEVEVDETQARELEDYHTILLTHLANGTYPPWGQMLKISSFVAQFHGF